MFGSLKKIFIPVLFVGVLVSQFYVVGVANAEGDDLCKGLITGTTVDGGNAGQNFFDAHGGPHEGANAGFYNNIVDLAIFGLAPGLAPGNRANAACVEKADGIYTAPGGQQQAYDYKIKGYVFNSNLGFISFNCENGVNDAGEGDGVACGPIDYGVYISPLGPNGEPRKLFGYAWNPAFGWIDFHKPPLVWDAGDQMVDPCGNPPCPFSPKYGVSLASDGSVSGKAWDEASVYMPFGGAKIFLPDQVVPVPVVNDPANWCDNKPYLCVMVDPYPENLKFGFEEGVAPGQASVKVADGTNANGYYVHLYLRNSTGNGPMTEAEYNFAAFTNINNIKLGWIDTVKIDQTSDTLSDFSSKRYPWREAVNPGAVTYKPLNFSDFQEYRDAGGVVDPGHYISRFPVSSYAPTSDGNLSLTTGTHPAFPFLNEQFIHDIGLDVPALNQLILSSITFTTPLIADVGNVTVLQPGAVYPNGKTGMSFKFRPAVEVNTLYADDFQDKIVAYRSIPMSFKIGAKKFGNLGIQNSAIKVDFNLAYAETATSTQDLCGGVDENITFDFHFLNDFLRTPLPDEASAAQGATVSSLPNTKLSDLMPEKDIQAKATLAVAPDNPCANVVAPTLYSMVHYFPVAGKPEVKYYSNKLPRIAGDFISNPAVVVHGNVFSQMVRNIQKDVLIQTSGSVNVNIVRDTINENLEKYLTTSEVNGLTTNPDICTITDLSIIRQRYDVGGCARGTDYVKIVIGDENVLYFKGKSVAVDFNGTSGAFDGKWVVVSADGNIFIDRDIYNVGNSDATLSLVAFRSTVQDQFFKTGNVYLAPCSSGLRNIQATIIADGSVFSYNGLKMWGDPNNPAVWNGDNFLMGINNVTGEPEWGNYAKMVSGLSCQLLIEGAIYSDNTIGGADLDKGSDPKQYLLAGGGAVINLPANLAGRIKAQLYDLNYLRMFRQSIEITDAGLPMDQQCGMGLTNEDIRRILNKEFICGEKNPCTPDENFCNGIDTLNPVVLGGDLVSPKNGDSLAKGLKNDPNVVGNTDFDPVYVFYKAPAKNSFLFSKAGVVNVGGQ